MAYFFYALYTFLSYLALPFAFLRLLKKSKITPAYRQRWSERLGHPGFKLGFELNNKKSIWIHTVSLGEAITAYPLISRLLKNFPDHDFIITSMTPTGSEFIQQKIQSLNLTKIKHCYLPYDLPVFIKRFLKQIKPEVLILIETELWPNLLKYAHQNSIKIILANARLSQRSYLNYARFKTLSFTMLNFIDLIMAQTPEDAERFKALGFTKKLKITASLKFDLSIPDNISEKSQVLKNQIINFKTRPIWIAASTHEGEETYLLDIHRHLLKTNPNTLLILVPRHPERFSKIKKLCEQENFSIQTRSSQEVILPSTQIFLGDSMGELLIYYSLAKIAFVGGSLVPRGGHNLLEPAALKIPVITGPHVFNFQQITETLVQAGGALLISEIPLITQALRDLFQEPERAQKMGELAYQVIQKNKGALDRQHALIKQLIEEKHGEGLV